MDFLAKHKICCGFARSEGCGCHLYFNICANRELIDFVYECASQWT